MSLPVRRVIKLICPKPPAFFGKAAGDVIVILWIPIRFFRHCLDLGAERAEQMHLFRRLIIRNNDECSVTFGPADYGKPDAGVARGTFHDG